MASIDAAPLARGARSPAEVALAGSLVLLAFKLARTPLNALFPSLEWTFDIVAFVVMPLVVLVAAARITGWRLRKLAGFELRKPGSIFEPPRVATIVVAAPLIAAADLFLTLVLAWPVHWLQQLAPPGLTSPQGMIAAAPVRWIAVAYMCLTAGIVEEIMYRGLTAHYFLYQGRPRPGLYLLVTTVMFTLGHAGRGMGVMLIAAVTALVFGAWLLRTRDLTTLVVAHTLIDFWWFG